MTVDVDCRSEAWWTSRGALQAPGVSARVRWTRSLDVTMGDVQASAQQLPLQRALARRSVSCMLQSRNKGFVLSMPIVSSMAALKAASPSTVDWKAADGSLADRIVAGLSETDMKAAGSSRADLQAGLA